MNGVANMQHHGAAYLTIDNIPLDFLVVLAYKSTGKFHPWRY